MYWASEGNPPSRKESIMSKVNSAMLRNAMLRNAMLRNQSAFA